MQVLEAREVAEAYIDLLTEDEEGGTPAGKVYVCTGCSGLVQRYRKFNREVQRHLDFMAHKFPAVARIVLHYLERERCCKVCGCCWFSWMLFLTAFGLLWLIIMTRNLNAMPLDNPELIKAIKELQQRNCTFNNVCLFKDWTYFKESTLGKVINHQGVVLEVVNASGMTESFVQLEYGARGTFWQLSTAPYPDPRYGIVTPEKVSGIKCRYRCGEIDPSQRDPKRMLWFLEKYRDLGYNIMHYNCLVFSEMVYQFHLPVNGTERCLTTRNMTDRYAEVTRCSGGDKSACLKSR